MLGSISLNKRKYMTKVQSLRVLALQSQDAIELLTSKWRITILHLLTSGPLRHNQLQRAIERVSPKMLTQTLRGMERDGLIARQIHRVIPPHVEYQLNPMGETLIPLLRNLCHWAKANAQRRDEARHRFDHPAKDGDRARSSSVSSTRPRQ